MEDHEGGLKGEGARESGNVCVSVEVVGAGVAAVACRVQLLTAFKKHIVRALVPGRVLSP